MNEVIKDMGNARLLYKELSFSNSDWQKEDGKILHYIETYPRLLLAHDFTYLYFFSTKLQNESFWLAREIVGYPSTLSEGYQTYDLNSGKFLRIEFKKNWFDITLEEVEALGREKWTELSKVHKLDQTWRVCLDWQVATPKIYFEYFFAA